MPRGLEKKQTNKETGDEGNNMEASRGQKEVRMCRARTVRLDHEIRGKGDGESN